MDCSEPQKRIPKGEPAPSFQLRSISRPFSFPSLSPHHFTLAHKRQRESIGRNDDVIFVSCFGFSFSSVVVGHRSTFLWVQVSQEQNREAAFSTSSLQLRGAETHKLQSSSCCDIRR